MTQLPAYWPIRTVTNADFSETFTFYQTNGSPQNVSSWVSSMQVYDTAGGELLFDVNVVGSFANGGSAGTITPSVLESVMRTLVPGEYTYDYRAYVGGATTAWLHGPFVLEQGATLDAAISPFNPSATVLWESTLTETFTFTNQFNTPQLTTFAVTPDGVVVTSASCSPASATVPAYGSVTVTVTYVTSSNIAAGSIVFAATNAHGTYFSTFTPTTETDYTALAAQFTTVVALRDARFGLQTQGFPATQVVQWNDARGSSAGLPIVVATPGTHLVVQGSGRSAIIVGDGTTNAFGSTSYDERYDLSTGTFTVYVVGLAQETANDQSYSLVNSTNGDAMFLRYYSGPSGHGLGMQQKPSATILTCGVATPGSFGPVYENRVVVTKMVSAGTSAQVQVPPWYAAGTATVTAPGSSPCAEWIGNAPTDGFITAFGFQAIIVVAGSTTTAQDDYVVNWAQTWHTAVNNPPYFITWVGDSILGGFGLNDRSTRFQAVAMQGTTIPSVYGDVNIGEDGEQVATMLANYTVEGGAYYQAGRTSDIVCMQGGTNDILTGGASAATIYGYLQSYAQLVHAQGRKVVVGTILPVGTSTGTQETTRLTLNSMIRANIGSGGGSLFDAVADVGNDPTMGQKANCTNATYFQADEEHPTSAGHALLAPYWANAVAAV